MSKIEKVCNISPVTNNISPATAVPTDISIMFVDRCTLVENSYNAWLINNLASQRFAMLSAQPFHPFILLFLANMSSLFR
jgi:hypothetical protein